MNCLGIFSCIKNRLILKRLVGFFIFFQFMFIQVSNAQSSYQVWLEYKPAYSFPRNYKIGMRASYRTNVEDPRWRTFELRLMPEKKLSKHIDIVASVQFLETLQYEAYSTSEIRLAVGGRWHFLPGRRVTSGVLARVEFRNVYKQEKKDWAYTTRGRIRIFASVPLNQKSMSGNNIWYTTGFVEFFLQNDKDIDERYANRMWFRLGMGYKLNHNLSFELVFNRQDSKNTIGDGYEDLTNENIFLFCMKHKLNKPKK